VEYADIADFAEQIARQAGQLIKRERDTGSVETDYKAQHELVTNADLKADKLITSAIRERFPDHRIMSEEISPDTDQAQDVDSPLWIIDPIDGTINYAHGHPQSAVSIAYAENGHVQVGVVHSPFCAGTGETFVGVRGHGARLNGNTIRHSHQTRVRNTLFATGFPYRKDTLGPIVRRLGVMLEQCQDLRRLGSAALDICWVACGRLDAYYESVSPWDFAAGRIIALEAGAIAGHFSDVPEGESPDLWGQDIIIAAPGVYEELRNILRKA